MKKLSLDVYKRQTLDILVIELGTIASSRIPGYVFTITSGIKMCIRDRAYSSKFLQVLLKNIQSILSLKSSPY